MTSLLGVKQADRIGFFPLPFASAVHDLSRFAWDRRIRISELEPPTHIAPYAVAIDAEIAAGDEEVASGRLILLHDPSGNDLWGGDFRCVTFAQAEVGPEMVHDPFLADVGWSWLTDALQARDADYTGASGTITTTASTPFGTKRDDPPQSQIEIRASWTPLLDEVHLLTQHLDAWQDLLLQIAGLPTESDTVIPLAARSAARR